MSQLIIPVGIPGCGKSTWGERFFNTSDDQIVSTDSIRASLGDINDQSRNDEVFDEYHRVIDEDLSYGLRVYADATNLDAFARERLLKIGKVTRSKVHLIVFTNTSQAIHNNSGRERKVPPHVMVRMLDKYEKFQMALPQESIQYDSVTEIRRVA